MKKAKKTQAKAVRAPRWEGQKKPTLEEFNALPVGATLINEDAIAFGKRKDSVTVKISPTEWKDPTGTWPAESLVGMSYSFPEPAEPHEELEAEKRDPLRYVGETDDGFSRFEGFEG